MNEVERSQRIIDRLMQDKQTLQRLVVERDLIIDDLRKQIREGADAAISWETTIKNTREHYQGLEMKVESQHRQIEQLRQQLSTIMGNYEH